MRFILNSLIGQLALSRASCTSAATAVTPEQYGTLNADNVQSANLTVEVVLSVTAEDRNAATRLQDTIKEVTGDSLSSDAVVREEDLNYRNKYMYMCTPHSHGAYTVIKYP